MNIRRKIVLAGMALAMLCCLSACPYEDYYYGSDYYEPVYMTRAELEASVKFTSVRPLVNPGKIYVQANRLFICEPYKGVHVIDNSNPAQPSAIDFIVIPGCVDIAVRGNILYADNAVDLVAVDLDQRKEIEAARERNAFTSIAPPNNGSWWLSSGQESTGKIIVGFTKKERRRNENLYE
jgi:hypothetical protein